MAVLILITVLLFFLFVKTKKKGNKYPVTPVVEQKTPLDFIQITLSEKNYKKLKKKRDKALSVGILETENTDYVPARITYNGEDFKAMIRLKGDWTDHLQGDKWSFRVKLKGDKTIKGMRKFSLHHPKTRGYINEWLYHKAVKKEGLIGLRYEFLEGSIHIKKKNSNKYINKNVGIYAIEETFDKRLIENNKRKESIILKFAEDYWWNGVKQSKKVGNPYGLKWQDFMHYNHPFPVKLFSESKLLQDTTMHNYFTLSKWLIQQVKQDKLPLSSAFDAKEIAMQNAILNLFGAEHGNYIINIRFYYNPITSKLEPIAFDGNSGHRLNKYVPFYFYKNSKKKDSAYLKELTYALQKIAKPEYLDTLIQENKKELDYYQKILKTEFKNSGLSTDNIIYNQRKVIKDKLYELAKVFNIQNEVIPKDDTPIVVPEFSKWNYKNILVSQTNQKFANQKVYNFKRKDISKNSFVVINNIKVEYGEKYQVSFLAKKGENGKYLALRIQGKYPHRVDAVFDLETGKVVGKKSSGSFASETAFITKIQNGWYMCTLSGEVYASEIKILFGSTIQNKIGNWESASNKKIDVNVVPSSVKIKRKIIDK